MSQKKGDRNVKSWFSNNWTGLATVVLIGIGGLFAYCRFTAGCVFAASRQPANPTFVTQKKSTGEETMSTDTQNAIVYASEENFEEEVLRSEVPVLVDFYADWCGPCRALGPVLEELAEETPDAKIVKVNVDDSPQLAGQYRVSSIPNLIVFKDGKIVAQQAGLAGKKQLKALLDK
jgi:thioredoxin 1